MKNRNYRKEIIETLEKLASEEKSQISKLLDPNNMAIQFGIISGVGLAIDYVVKYFDDIEENEE